MEITKTVFSDHSGINKGKQQKNLQTHGNYFYIIDDKKKQLNGKSHKKFKKIH